MSILRGSFRRSRSISQNVSELICSLNSKKIKYYQFGAGAT